MNRKFFHLALFFSVTLLFSCSSGLFGKTGKGSIITENRLESSFQVVELQTSADVEITKGDLFKVEVSDYENIVSYTSVKIENNKLVIFKKPETTILVNSKAKVTITMPDELISVVLTGSGDIKINSPFKSLETMRIVGSGDISSNDNLNLVKLNASIIGSGNITAKGSVDNFTALISGSGDLDFLNLIAKEAKCTITGSGNISINATSTLDVTITGSGNVIYTGNPIVQTTVSGSGRLIHR